MTDNARPQDPLATLLHDEACEFGTPGVVSDDWRACRHPHEDESALSRAAGVTLTQPQPDAGLREAAQAVVDRVDAIDPSFEAQPVPEIEALRAALRSTPAAPKEDDRE